LTFHVYIIAQEGGSEVPVLFSIRAMNFEKLYAKQLDMLLAKTSL
jgi:hypothetical protein